LQYREELVNAVSSILTESENKKSKLLNAIQLHAIAQLKDGYTSFRISKLKKEDERYLKEWADLTCATVKVIKFRCFSNGKRYVVRQYIVSLRNIVCLEYDLEGKTLVL